MVVRCFYISFLERVHAGAFFERFLLRGAMVIYTDECILLVSVYSCLIFNLQARLPLDFISIHYGMKKGIFYKEIRSGCEFVGCRSGGGLDSSGPCSFHQIALRRSV